MLRAAFQRGGIVRQILRDAQASSAADEGLLMMFGGIEGTPHAKKSSLSAWRSSVVIDGSNASKRNLGQGSSGGTKTADIGARMSLEGRPLGTQRR